MLNLKLKKPENQIRLNQDLSTNGGYVAHLLRLGHAAETPKGLIFAAPLAAGIAAIATGSPLMVGLVAGGFCYGVYESLQAKRRLIRQSYQDPDVLVKGTTGDDRLTLLMFFKQHKPEDDCVVKGSKTYATPPTTPEAKPESSAPTQPEPADPKAEGASFPHPEVLAQIDIPHWRRQILLSAAQREGKTNLLRVLLCQQPGKVHYMSSKFNDEIPPNWNGHLISGTKDQILGRLGELADEWQQLFQDHANGTRTELEWLVFDELFYFQELAKQNRELKNDLNALIISLATQGSSCNLGSVLIAQTKNAGSLGLSEDLLRQNYIVVSPAKSKHSEALLTVEKLVRGREQYHPETRREALAIAKARPYSAFLAMDSEVLSIYYPPEYQGELKPLEPVMVGGNVLRTAVLSKISHTPQSAGDIRKSFPSQNRPPLDAIQAMLDSLVEDQEIAVRNEGKAPKYQQVVLPPSAPPSPLILPVRVA